MSERIGPDRDVLRVVEKCIDVLLTEREENHKTARMVAEGLSVPVVVVKPAHRPCGVLVCPNLAGEPRYEDPLGNFCFDHDQSKQKKQSGQQGEP